MVLCFQMFSLLVYLGLCHLTYAKIAPRITIADNLGAVYLFQLSEGIPQISDKMVLTGWK